MRVSRGDRSVSRSPVRASSSAPHRLCRARGKILALGRCQGRADAGDREKDMAAEWYFRVSGAGFGPVSGAELVQQAADRRIGPETEVRKGTGPWVAASKVTGLFP